MADPANSVALCANGPSQKVIHTRNGGVQASHIAIYLTMMFAIYPLRIL